MAVQLTGYQGPRGFKAEQVYDKSGQMMQQAKQDAQYRQDAFASYKEDVQRLGADIAKNQENDLRALSQFSDTLSTFLVDYQKKQNDKEYKLGLAEVMNGNVQFPESTIQQHNADVDKLKAAAEADGEAANTAVEQGQESFGAQFRQKSPAIKGWRAYGQAVGQAKKTGLMSQAFLAGFWERTEPIVPMPDGTFKSPAQIKSEEGTLEEIAAANSIALAEISQKNGLYNINPVIIAEEFAPSWQAASSAQATNLITGIAADRRETAIANYSNALKLDVTKASNAGTSQERTQILGQSYQTNVDNLVLEGGLSRGKAAQLAFQAQLSAIRQLPKDEALAALDALADVPKIAKDPKSGTLGQFHFDQIKETRDAIISDDIERLNRQEAADNREVRKIIGRLQEARRTAAGDPGKLAELTKFELETLEKYAGMGNAAAITFLDNERANQMMPSDYVERNGLLRQADEGTLTVDQVDKSNLPESEKKILRERANDAARVDFNKTWQKASSDQAASEVLKGSKKAKPYVLDAGGKPTEDPAAFAVYSKDVQDRLFDWYQQYKQSHPQGQAPSDAETRAELERLSQALYPSHYNTETGRAYPLKFAEGISVTTNAQGAEVFDLTQVGDLSQATSRGRFSSYDKSIVLNQEDLAAEVTRYQNGEPPSRRVQTYLGTDIGKLSQFLNSQLRHYGLPTTDIDSSERAQSERAQRYAAPYAANRRFSTTDPLAEARASREIAIARQERERFESQERGEAPKATTSSKQGLLPALPDDQILQLAIDAGLPPEKAKIMLAIALAESSGIPNNNNFNRSTGDESYGLWQINMIDALGPERARDLGLTSYSQLEDPATNARAMAYVLGRQGFNAWSVHKHGLHRRYLPAAERALARWKARQQ